MNHKELYEKRRIYYNAYRDAIGLTEESHYLATAAAKKAFPDPIPQPRFVYLDNEGFDGPYRIVDGMLQNNLSGIWTTMRWQKAQLQRLLSLFDEPMDPNP